MTTPCALFSTVQYPANSWTLSPNRLTAATDSGTGSVFPKVFPGVSLVSGRYYVAFTVGATGFQASMGVGNTSELATQAGNLLNAVILAQDPSTNNGKLYSSVGGTFTLLHTFGNVNDGDTVLLCFDAGLASVYAQVVQGGVGSGWNPQNAGANPDTNTGGIIVPGITAFTPFVDQFVASGGSGATVVMNSGGSSYPITMPTTFGNLPPTIQITSLTVRENSLSVVNWAGDDVTQLQYSLDGGAWTNCGGTVTGSGGAATFPLITDLLIHNIQLRDSGNSIDGMPAMIFSASPLGNTLISQAGTLTGDDTSTGTLAFPGGPVSEIFFNTNLNYLSGTGFATIAVQAEFFASDGTALFGVGVNYSVGPPVTWGDSTSWYPSAIPGRTAQTGTNSVYNVSGTLSVYESGGNVMGNLTADVNGTVFTSDALVLKVSSTSANLAYCIVTNDATFDTSEYSIDVSAPDSAETLTITSAECIAGGTLSIGGTFEDAALEYVNVSTNDGGSFALGVDTSITGSTSGSFATSTSNTLSAGTYEIVAQDAVTGVESPPYELTVTSTLPETLTLSLASGINGSPLSLGGESWNGPPVGLNVSLNGAAGPWQATVGYESASGTTAAAWGAQGPTLSPGTYTVMVQDAVQTSVLSNGLSLVVNSSGGGGSGGGGLNTIPFWQASDFFAAFQKLMPRGRAWPLQLSAVMNQVLLALMPTYVRVTAACINLLIDAFPATTVNLLTQWNESVGLPNACTPLGATIAQQQAAIVQKLTATGGQSVPYFIGVAAALGFDITIVELAPETRTWVVHGSPVVAPVLFRAGQSSAGDYLQLGGANSQLECVLNRIKPADTILEFVYP